MHYKKRGKRRGLERGGARGRRRERERKNIRVGASTSKKRKKKRMVLVQQRPQDTGKEYPRTVKDASIPSPSFSYPFQDPQFPLSSSSSALLSFQVVNMPHPALSGFAPCKRNRRLLQTLQGSPLPSFSSGFRRGSFLLPFIYPPPNPSPLHPRPMRHETFVRIAKSRALREA